MIFVGVGGIGIGVVVLEGALAIGPVIVPVLELDHVHYNPIVVPIKPSQLLAVAGTALQHLPATEVVGLGEHGVAVGAVNGERRGSGRRRRRLGVVGHGDGLV